MELFLRLFTRRFKHRSFLVLIAHMYWEISQISVNSHLDPFEAPHLLPLARLSIFSDPPKSAKSYLNVALYQTDFPALVYDSKAIS